MSKRKESCRRYKDGKQEDKPGGEAFGGGIWRRRSTHNHCSFKKRSLFRNSITLHSFFVRVKGRIWLKLFAHVCRDPYCAQIAVLLFASCCFVSSFTAGFAVRILVTSGALSTSNGCHLLSVVDGEIRL